MLNPMYLNHDMTTNYGSGNEIWLFIKNDTHKLMYLNDCIAVGWMVWDVLRMTL